MTITDADLDAAARSLTVRLNRVAALEAELHRPRCSTPGCKAPAMYEFTIRTENHLQAFTVRWCDRHCPSHNGEQIVSLDLGPPIA